jgi:hypothetical protein
MARLRLWLVTLPLVAATSQAASILLDRLAPKDYTGAEVFSASTMSHKLLAPAAAVAAVALVVGFWSFARPTRATRRLPRWVFACLPAVAFAVQEHVERLVAGQEPVSTLCTNRFFLLGLALQLPFGIVAYFAARLLIGLASAIADRNGATRPALRLGPAISVPLDEPARHSRRGSDRGHTRGPPLLLAPR